MPMPYERFSSLTSLSTITSQPEPSSSEFEIPGVEHCEIPPSLQPFINLKRFVIKRNTVCPGSICASRTCTIEVSDGHSILTWETQCGDDTTMYFNEKGPVMATEIFDNCYCLRMFLAGCQPPRMEVQCPPQNPLGTVYYHSNFGCSPEFEVRNQSNDTLFKIRRSDVCCCDCGSQAFEIVQVYDEKRVGRIDREKSFCVAEGTTCVSISNRLSLQNKILLVAAITYIDYVGEQNDCYVQNLLPCA